MLRTWPNTDQVLGKDKIVNLNVNGSFLFLLCHHHHHHHHHQWALTNLQWVAWLSINKTKLACSTAWLYRYTYCHLVTRSNNCRGRTKKKKFPGVVRKTQSYKMTVSIGSCHHAVEEIFVEWIIHCQAVLSAALVSHSPWFLYPFLWTAR